MERYSPTTTHMGNNMSVVTMETDPTGDYVLFPDDGRPMTADAFIAALLEANVSYQVLPEALVAWNEGAWDEAVDIIENAKYPDKRHSSHEAVRSSMSDQYDMICDTCGKTDYGPGGWGSLRTPCI